MSVALDRAREVIHRCRVLAGYTDEPGAVTRTFLSPPMHGVHAEVSAWMIGAGMQVTVDAAGNIRGVYPAASADAPRLFVGSHLDTVPDAGAFDGILGVMLGIALVEQLDGRRMPFGIEVVGFSDEEGVRFGIPFIGSRALASRMDDALLARVDARQVSVAEAIRQFGLDPAAVDAACVTHPALGYLEIHIEQGPVLDRMDSPLGIVSAIAGQTRATIIFSGASGHAGTTPMTDRRDAAACAAEWIVQVERQALATPGLVATVGRIDVSPGAGNVIAGRCVTSLDVRHEDDAVRTDAADRMRAAARDIAARRHLDVAWRTDLDQPAVAMTPTLVDALTRAVASTGAPIHVMPSGAGHDAMVMAAVMPAAMLFVRSPGGISHHPDESVAADDVAAALVAGAVFLNDLAETTRG